MPYPNLTFSRPRTRKRLKKQAPEEVSLPVPVQSALIATDGKTAIPSEVHRRGEMVEIVGTMRLMADKESGLQWIERIL